MTISPPSDIVLEEYRFRQRQSELERARLHRLRHTPAVTLDGQSVDLLANIELPGDAASALSAGAVGAADPGSRSGRVRRPGCGGGTGGGG